MPVIRTLCIAAAIGSLVSTQTLEAATLTLTAKGAADDLGDTLRSVMDTRAVVEGKSPSAQDIVAAAQADYSRLVAALYDRGYYAPKISIRLDGQEAANLPPFDTPSRITNVVVTVEPGPRFVFGQTRVAPLPQGVGKPASLAEGEVAELQRIKDGAADAVESWRSVGHAKAQIARQSITADHRANTIDVDLGVETGPRVTFGNLKISGLKKSRPERVRKIAGIPTGQTFDPKYVERAEKRLRRTGVFGVVSLSEAETVGPDAILDIEAELSERKPRRFGFGAEFDTLEGAKVSAFWMHRNFFGGAERFRVEGEVSGIDGDLDGVDYSTTVSLARPATGHPDQTMTLSLGYNFTDDPAYTGDQIEAGVTFDRIVSEQLTVGYGASLVGTRATDAFGEREFRVMTLPLSATYDRRDDSLDAKSGYYLNLTTTPYLGWKGTDSGARFTADARGYMGLGAEDRFVLAGRLQLGSIVGSDIDNTPPDFLFMSGGGGTVRGQAFQSLGVVQPSGDLAGGLNFVGLSSEARVKATEKFSVVAFYDMGFIGDSPVPGQNGDWHSGVGLGVRYDTILGPIRFDIATPASGDRAYQAVTYYVGLGQSF